jgi:hypothetical protein
VRIFRNPGLYLFLMGWWIIPFFVTELATHPVNKYFSSYVPFFIAFAVLGSSAYILGLLNGAFGFWARCSVWKRFGLLVGVYALSVILIVVLVIILDSYGLVKYFGGDAGGSFGLFFIPSIVIYIVLGMLICLASGADTIDP